ncbi:MAG: cytochrome b/b6 domain-containing protein [Alphaproteobacteria bacterium]|nr:cytochrome b/b6 domain-containing protein [Alphaproteobacteria bacterium]
MSQAWPVAAPGAAAVPPQRIMIWDIVVRVFHWTVVAGVTANLFLAEGSKHAHHRIGYLVLVAVAVRLVWGLVGTRHARFSDFVPRPARLWSYAKALLARREPRYVGHNPAGAVMMIALIVLLAVCGVTGWMQTLDAFWGVPWVQDLHEAAANIIMVLAGLHIFAAVRESVRHRENLIWSMITGRKRASSGSDVDHATASGRR